MSGLGKMVLRALNGVVNKAVAAAERPLPADSAFARDVNQRRRRKGAGGQAQLFAQQTHDRLVSQDHAGGAYLSAVLVKAIRL